MPLNLTEEQIIQLAPDESSVKAGKGLANPGKWVLLACSERAVWGHCQGSGKNPYQTAIDLNNIAFKCSCPSRKFPCKHGLGLLLLFASKADLFEKAEEPDWVTAWLAKREEKAGKKEQKARNEKPVDAAAQAKRQEKRHQNILNSIEDLETWMKDLVRNGLVNVPERAGNLFENMARRMVDAQATGLAGRLRAIEEISFLGEEWKYELTDRLGKLYLLAESYRNLENQPEEWKEEIRTQTGYPQSKEDVLAGEPLADQWIILHKRRRVINDLTTDTYWLYGKQNGIYAIMLQFITPGSFADINLLPGCIYNGKIYFYKGVGNPRRALFQEPTLTTDTFIPRLCPNLKEGATVYRKAMLQNPLSENIPVCVDQLRLTCRGNQFYVRDTDDDEFPVRLEEEKRMGILAVTGGKPFAAFFLAEATSWELVSIWYQATYYTWKDERD